jgi:hypothetical protein
MMGSELGLARKQITVGSETHRYTCMCRGSVHETGFVLVHKTTRETGSNFKTSLSGTLMSDTVSLPHIYDHFPITVTALGSRRSINNQTTINGNLS